MDPRRDSRCSGPGEAEGGVLKLRETSPRSPTPGLPGPARPKRDRPWDSGVTVAIGATPRRFHDRQGHGWWGRMHNS